MFATKRTANREVAPCESGEDYCSHDTHKEETPMKENKRDLAVIVGAGGDIGAATVMEFQRRGYRTASLCRNEHGWMPHEDVDSTVHFAELNRYFDPLAFWKDVSKLHGKAPTVIAYCSSRFSTDPVWSAEAIEEHMLENVYIPMRLGEKLKRGALVVLSDRRRVYETRAAYGISLAARTAMIKHLALLKSPEVTANELLLGPITPLISGVGGKEATARTLGPARRKGSAEEVAEMVAHVAETPYLNGCSVSFDGGLSVKDYH